MTTRINLDQEIRKYVRKISDEDLKFLSLRLSQRLGSDLSDSLCLIQDRYPELNRFLSGAPTCEEVYNTVDLIEKHVQESCKKFLLMK